MKILYLGDVMGEPGILAVERLLPEIKRTKKVNLVIAQAENLSDGKGIVPADFRRLQAAGVDAGTGGNWSLHNPAALSLLNDPAEPLIRPANYPAGTPGKGFMYVGGVLIISLLGQIVGRDAHVVVDNPLRTIDAILSAQANVKNRAVVVNLHGDYSSEKLAIGHYLRGRATMVVGDHWHVPTNDAQLLEGGTAHQTDVGMCGSLDSCLGIDFNVIEKRWLGGQPSRNRLEVAGRLQLNGLLVTVDTAGRANSFEVIRRLDGSN